MSVDVSFNLLTQVQEVFHYCSVLLPLSTCTRYLVLPYNYATTVYYLHSSTVQNCHTRQQAYGKRHKC
jgi:hypothetical protein